MSTPIYDYYLQPLTKDNSFPSDHTAVPNFTYRHFDYLKTISKLSSSRQENHNKVLTYLKKAGQPIKVSESQNSIFILFKNGKWVKLGFENVVNEDLGEDGAADDTSSNNSGSSSSNSSRRSSSSSLGYSQQRDANNRALPAPPTQAQIDAVPTETLADLRIFTGGHHSERILRFALARRNNEIDLAVNDILDGNVEISRGRNNRTNPSNRMQTQTSNIDPPSQLEIDRITTNNVDEIDLLVDLTEGAFSRDLVTFALARRAGNVNLASIDLMDGVVNMSHLNGTTNDQDEEDDDPEQSQETSEEQSNSENNENTQNSSDRPTMTPKERYKTDIANGKPYKNIAIFTDYLELKMNESLITDFTATESTLFFVSSGLVYSVDLEHLNEDDLGEKITKITKISPQFTFSISDGKRDDDKIVIRSSNFITCLLYPKTGEYKIFPDTEFARKHNIKFHENFNKLGQIYDNFIKNDFSHMTVNNLNVKIYSKSNGFIVLGYVCERFRLQDFCSGDAVYETLANNCDTIENFENSEEGGRKDSGIDLDNCPIGTKVTKTVTKNHTKFSKNEKLLIKNEIFKFETNDHGTEYPNPNIPLNRGYYTRFESTESGTGKVLAVLKKTKKLPNGAMLVKFDDKSTPEVVDAKELKVFREDNSKESKSIPSPFYTERYYKYPINQTKITKFIDNHPTKKIIWAVNHGYYIFLIQIIDKNDKLLTFSGYSTNHHKLGIPNFLPNFVHNLSDVRIEINTERGYLLAPSWGGFNKAEIFCVKTSENSSVNENEKVGELSCYGRTSNIVKDSRDTLQEKYCGYVANDKSVYYDLRKDKREKSVWNYHKSNFGSCLDSSRTGRLRIFKNFCPEKHFNFANMTARYALERLNVLPNYSIKLCSDKNFNFNNNFNSMSYLTNLIEAFSPETLNEGSVVQSESNPSSKVYSQKSYKLNDEDIEKMCGKLKLREANTNEIKNFNQQPEYKLTTNNQIKASSMHNGPKWPKNRN